MRLILVMCLWLPLTAYAKADPVYFETQDLSRDDFQIELITERRNADGHFYHASFSTHYPNSPLQYPSRLVIKDLRTNTTLFNQPAPEFTHSYVSPDSRFILLYSRSSLLDGDIWLFDNGRVVFQGQRHPSIAEKVNLVELEKNFSPSSANLLSGDIANNKESSMKNVVVLTCGAGTWIEEVSEILIDKQGKSIGFAFVNYGKHYTWSFDRVETLQSLTSQQILSTGLQPSNQTFCSASQQFKDAVNNTVYSRWCEDMTGLKQGPYEQWLVEIKSLDRPKPTIQQQAIKVSPLKILSGEFNRGRAEGLWTRSPSESEFIVKCDFSNGKLHGRCEEFELDQSYRTEADFDHGLLNGLYRVWIDNQLDFVCEYSNGIRNGRCAAYENNQLYQDCYYNGPNEQGVCTEYENGYKHLECEMLGNQYHGRCTRFDTAGSVLGIEYYQFDNLIEDS